MNAEKTPTVNDWARAIYIDFEGRMHEPASFLGVACDGVWSVSIIEPALWPLAERGHSLGEVEAGSAHEVFKKIRERAVSERRLIVAWSEREEKEILETPGLTQEDRDWWADNLINGLALARTWAKKLSLRIEPKKSNRGSTNNNPLSSYLKVIGYNVPSGLGSGLAAQRILHVRKQLTAKTKIGDVEKMTRTAKSKWTRGLGHNYHDCIGLSLVMLTLQRWIDSAEVFLKTELAVQMDEGIQPLIDVVGNRRRAFHVITAWNPGGVLASADENSFADARLLAEIQTRRLEAYRAVGSDPDSPHKEDGWIVAGMKESEAVDLGRRFGQIAIFRIEQGRLTVVGCQGNWRLSRPL
jgi:hypothetical protein